MMPGETLLALLAIGFVVGTLIGAVGVGGVLLIPALAALGSLGMREAMATALFTFIFTGIAGTLLFRRRGSIDARIAAPLSAGALLLAFAGAWAHAHAPPGLLSLVLAVLIVLAGVYAIGTWPARTNPPLRERPRAQRALLAALGGVAGFGSGLTGVGGPAISVPLMLLCGFPALATVGASQVIQVIAALSGTLGHLAFGTIDVALALPLTVAEVAGVHAGARIAHAIDALLLRRLVGAVCIPTGLYVLARALDWP